MRQRFDKVFLFFFLAMASGAISRVFGGHGSLQAGGTNSTAISSGNSDPILLLFTVLLSGVAIVGGFRKLLQIRTLLLGMIGIPMLYLFAASSMLWSAGPTSTLRAFAYLLVYLAASAYIAVQFSEAELVHHIGNAMILMGLLSIAGHFDLPAVSDLAPGWTGIFPQKNDLGAAMAIGIGALMVSTRKWSLTRISGLVLCVVLLLLSQSFTAVVTAGAATIAVLYARTNTRVRTVLLLAAACVAVVFAFSVSSLGDAFTMTTGKDPTFTGRTEIWELVEGKIFERPLLGFGYAAFWSTQADSINQFSAWKPGQAHNGYLQICLDLGVAGLMLVLVLIRESFRRAKRLRSEHGSNGGLWLLVVLLMLLVRNFAEASFMDLSLTWCAMLLAAFSSKRIELLAQGMTEVKGYRARRVLILSSGPDVAL